MRLRTVRNVAVGVIGLVIVVLVAAFITVQTNWFRNYVRTAIVESVESGVGGRVEIGSFEFDPMALHAVVRNFVIHGTEPAGTAPFVSVARLELYLRLFTGLRHLYELSYLGVERPEVSIVTLANGQTNIPTPVKKSTSDRSALETVVNLAVGSFAIDHGMVSFASTRQALDVRGRNLQAQIDYSFITQSYTGRLGMEPLYVLNGKNTPVNFKVSLPLKISKDRIEVTNGSLSTALSEVELNASLEDMKNPRLAGTAKGRLAIQDLANAGNLPVSPARKGEPKEVDLELSGLFSNSTIRVEKLRLRAGHSSVEASGALRDSAGKAGLDFNAALALDELGRMAKLMQHPAGMAGLHGTVTLDAANNLDANGTIEAANVSLQQGGRRISNVNLASGFHADNRNLEMKGLKLRAFGGEFAGDLGLADWERYRLTGALRGLNIQAASLVFGQRLPYDGTISGPVNAQGDLKAGAGALTGGARLSIAPGKRGIPVSGKLNAAYNGAANSITLDNSYVALPHSRFTLSGALNKRVEVVFHSQDLSDILALSKTPVPVALGKNGVAELNATVTGNLSDPRIAGHLAVNRFTVQGRQFDSLQTDFTASPSEARVANGSLSGTGMLARFDGSAAMKNWVVSQRSPIALNANVQNGDLADVMALAGQPVAGYSGALTAQAQVTGTPGNPRGNASLQVGSGTAAGEAFNRIQAQVNLADQTITIPAAFVDAAAGRIDVTAEYQHSRDSLTDGRLHAHVKSDRLDLARSQTVQKQQPNSGGVVRVNADVTGAVSSGEPAFLLTAVNADVSGQGLRADGQNFGDFNGTAKTSGQRVLYDVTSDFAGSNIHATGSTELRKDYPTQANATIANLPVERVLVLAKQGNVPVRGLVSGTVRLDGTVTAPQGSAELTLTRATVYGEAIDKATLRASYLAQAIDVQQLDVVAGNSHVELTGRFDHPVGTLERGRARFTVANGHLDLARLATVQQYRPGLAGAAEVNASGTASVENKEPWILPDSVDANVNATGIRVNGKSFGSLKLTANTTGGNRLNFALESDLAGSAIRASGNAALSGNYPVDAQVTFKNVLWTRVAELLGTTGGAQQFEAVADGQMTVKGPVLKADQLSGSLAVSRLSVSTIPKPGGGRPFTIANQGPVQAALDHGTLRIENAHLAGPNTDLQVDGTAQIFGTSQDLNLTVNGKADLALVQNFDRDAYSSGNVLLAGTVRGTRLQPLVNGQMTLQNVTFSYVGLPVGISSANGSVTLNGNSAQVRSFTAEMGGGRVNLTGFVAYSDVLRFGLRAAASNVRVRVQQGVSVVADADLRITGTTDASRVTGDVTVQRVTYAPQSDVGSILTRSAPPVQSPTTPSALLDNMKLEIRVRSAPGMTVESTLAESLQASADLRVRGSANEPGVLGRVNISEGKLTFFGASYTVTTGSIGFYNPVRIEPVLNVSLETQVKGVTVTLQVTGPVENMKLSYTSDPPLQFQEIVTLLASGKAPTSDPTLLANQPQQPAQGYQQLGESAILGQAVANPVATRLQRVFGVTQLKIDPSFTTGSSVPTARLSMQERITSNITFTYSSAVDNPNATLIRVEWAFNPQWSAVASRDENGLFSVNFFYKKSFR
jgi:translocation and assembly module TamB